MSTVRAAFLTFALAWASVAGAQSGATQINSNFNGTNIADTSFIWFNAHFSNISGVSGRTVIRFRNQFITLTVPSTGHFFELPVPNADVVIDPGAGITKVDVDSITGAWITTVPGTSGTPFISGLAWDVPPGENPRAANPVSWRGEFSTDRPGVSISWQWSAAVYTALSLNHSDLAVTAVDGQNGFSQSGTPAAFTQFVTGGARGGGGSNFTGSNSGTASVPNLPVFLPCPSDFNGDGARDPDDLSDFITCFFSPPGFCSRADFNGDGNVDPDDLSDFINTFKIDCP